MLYSRDKLGKQISIFSLTIKGQFHMFFFLKKKLHMFFLYEMVYMGMILYVRMFILLDCDPIFH